MESASRVRPRQPWLEVLAQDLRYGLRTLRRSPGFTAAALIVGIARDLKAMGAERFQMTILGVFAGIGLLLAAAGVYGLTAYSVAQRTRGLAVRMALGATRARILGSVIGEGLGLALSGVVLGTIAALFATRVLRNFVWEVSIVDPATFAGVALLLLAVSCAASAVPALRAVRLDQAAALRE